MARTPNDSPSFSPLLPLRGIPGLPPLPPPPTPRVQRPAPHPFTCPLPELGAPSAQPPVAIGYDAHDWSDHAACLTPKNARGQRLFLQRWLPLRAPPSSRDVGAEDTPDRAVPRTANTHTSRTRLPRGSRRSPWHRVWPWSTAQQSWRRLGKNDTHDTHPPQTGTAKAVVHVIHGLNDHSAKYRAVAKHLVRAGYAVIAHDAHGHGRSDGFRGHADSMQHYVDDARLAVAVGHARLPRHLQRLPKFLLGHSMGGAVAIHLARQSPQNEWAGVMLTAPAVQVYPKPMLRILAPVLATLAPLMPVQKLKFDRRRKHAAATTPAGAVTTCDHAEGPLQKRMFGKLWRWRRESKASDRVADKPMRDPLVIRAPVRARVGYEVLKSCQTIMQNASKFRASVFVAHSKGDRVTNARGSIQFTSRIGSRDKTLRLYDGHAHDLLADSPKSDVVIHDMIQWADTRVHRLVNLAREDRTRPIRKKPRARPAIAGHGAQ